MTVKETTEYFKEMVKGCGGYELCPCFTDDMEMTKIALAALEKQIPKRTTLLPIGMNAENGEEIRFVMCNTCKKPFMRDTRIKYCCFCGQAIDWSETE